MASKTTKKGDVKEQVVANPSGKGGLGDHPENINTGGRIDNCYTWKELFMRKAKEKKDKIERREIIADAVLNKAERGDIPAFKEVRDTMDGKPQQKTDLTTGGEKIGTVAEVIAAIEASRRNE